ncbi:LysE family transporter [Actinoplanes sp. NPDC051475]|uniref:LysE/ArgO family amino acid transporter n=1 Tax=Actinoplanes sp. NPDC051475 TaxID=3157225 RepID=UPI003450596D
MLASALAGFAASAVLIIAIGAQNAFVLRQGLRREHVVPVVLTCAISDVLLILAGIAGLGTVVGRHPALTYLNPHVYLDTVLLLGSLAQQYAHRWLFGVGAAAASGAWFVALGLGARRLAPVLNEPVAWRILDGLIAAVMAGLAVALLTRP